MQLAGLYGDEELRRRQENYLCCSLLIFETYCAEVRERRLPAFMLPRASQAVEEVRGQHAESRDLLREAIGKLH